MSESIEAVIADDEPKVDTQERKILEKGRGRELIERYESRGLTQEQFARREGIKCHTFVALLGRHRRAGGRKGVEAKFLEARVPSAPAVRLEVILPCEMMARGDNVQELPRLIRALEESSCGCVSGGVEDLPGG